MKPLPVLGLLATGTLLGASQPIGLHRFTLPDGFRIESVASTNDVLRPVNGSFDDQGRLYVTDSSGSTEPPAEQAKDPRWRVVRLEDADGDGRFERAVVFADRLPMLQGILWHQGAVYVGGSPAIWKLTDKDGDGRSDERLEWWNVGHPSTHCGNEVHGPYAGPDGFIYWTKGAFEPVRWTNSATGSVHRDRTSHIFRARPDGSGMESVMSGGMDNPVDVEFDREGEIFFTSTFIDFSRPGWRDGIGHASPGSVFGKVNSVLEDRAVFRPSPGLAHPFVQMGAAAPSGLASYHHDAFGPGFAGNLFASAFNLRKVTRVELTRSGSGFAGKDSDFVVSDNLDFHPTDVLVDRDGSVVILDTGGWYKLCCPSSQLWKADVLGGVYRVRKDGAPHRRTPAPSASDSLLARLRRGGDALDRGVVAPARQALAESLSRKDLFTARVALTALGRLKDVESVPSILGAVRGTEDDALHAAVVLALVRIGDAASLRQAVVGGPEEIRRAALIALDQVPSDALHPAELIPLLTAPEARLREAAVWISGRHPDWAEPIAVGLAGPLKAHGKPAIGAGDLARLLSAVATSDSGKSLVASALSAGPEDAVWSAAAVEAIRVLRPKNPPSEWREALAVHLAKAGHEARIPALAAAQALGSDGPLSEAILAIARDPGAPQEVRFAAYAALPSGWSAQLEDVALLVRGVNARRTGAAEALGRARVGSGDLKPLLGALQEAGPMDLPRLIPAVERLEGEESARAFVGALTQAKARAAIRPEVLRAAVKSRSEAVRGEAERLIGSLQAGRAEQQRHLAEIKASLPEGDIRRGQALFNSPKAACIQCHQLGYQGGDVGPDLTSIGTVRSLDDLLEAVVYPSASFVRSYEPTTVSTRDGEERTGILRRDDDRGVSLLLGPGVVQEIRREDIAELRPSTVSLMPAGLEEQFNRQELADLLAFLKNTKWGRN